MDENDERAGKHVVLELEWRQGFRDSLENHRARFKPMDSLENELLEDAVALWWRMQRAQAMETEMLELELQQEPEEDASLTRIARAMGRLLDSGRLGKLRRYESSLRREYLATAEHLRQMQLQRWAEIWPKPDRTRCTVA